MSRGMFLRRPFELPASRHCATHSSALVPASPLRSEKRTATRGHEVSWFEEWHEFVEPAPDREIMFQRRLLDLPKRSDVELHNCAHAHLRPLVNQHACGVGLVFLGEVQ